MIRYVLPTLLALVAPAAATIGDGAMAEGQITSVTIHERIIMRIPRVGPRKPDAPIVWKEKRGPKCIAASELAGALVSGRKAVDLVLVGGRRIRAKLDGDCMPLDFYSGFYIKAATDGMICADRDVIRSRSGAACQIDAFRALKPRN